MKPKKLSYHQRIVNFLAGHGRGWVSGDEIYTEIAHNIPAETADKEYQKRHPNWKNDPAKIRVAKGRKRLVILSLITMKHHRKIVETRETKEGKLYRLTRAAFKKFAQTVLQS